MKSFMLKALWIFPLSSSIFYCSPNNQTSKKENYFLNSFQHDGLYDQNVLQAYNSHRNVKGVAQKDYYAPIYFRNLKNNIGNNLYGTCNFVAMGMLLSFWDTYWGDSIIPEQYEMPPIFFDGNLTRDTDSPGIRKEFGPLFENLNNGYSDFANLKNNQWVLNNFFQIKLIDLWDSFIADLDSVDSTMSIANMSRFLFSYLRDEAGFNRSDFTIYNDTVSDRGEDYLRETIIDYVMDGIPVLVGIGHTTSDDYGSHTAIAYDYDEEKDELYFNMGWGNNASHIEMETFGYSSINNILVMDFATEHDHTDNYKHFYFGGMDSLCSCEYSNLCSIEEERQEFDDGSDITFKWSYLSKERWNATHNQNPYFLFSVSYYDDFNIVSPKLINGNQYTLNFDESVSLLQCSRYSAKVIPQHTGCIDCDEMSFAKNFLSPTVFEYLVSVLPEDYGLFNTTQFQTTDTLSVASIGENQLLAKVSNGRYNGTTVELDCDNSNSYIEYTANENILRIDYDITGSFDLLYKENGSWTTGRGDGTDYLLAEDESSDIAYIEFFKTIDQIRIVPSGTNVFIGEVSFWDKLPTSGYELPYDPSLWNRPNVVGKLNCYSYAINNQIDERNGNVLWGDFQFPGYYSHYENWTRVKTMQIQTNYPKRELQFAEDDFEVYSDDSGKTYVFEEIGRFDICEPNTYKIAFVYEENMEFFEWGGYHWYRQNPDGTWSQKNGSSDCTNLDESGKLILDPQIADRGEYKEFISYFKITPWNNIYVEN